MVPHRSVGRLGGIGLRLLVALVPLLSPTVPATLGGPATLRAELNGHPIPLAEISRLHCHDRAYPLIRCFGTSAERDADEAATALVAGSPASVPAPGIGASTSYPYVRWYRDANYGGPSFDAYVAYTDLGVIGWNDSISSFITYAGGHPRWWQNVGFSGVAWDWGSGVSVGYVGAAANDQFSSVERL